jgi:hypothetical protein
VGDEVEVMEIKGALEKALNLLALIIFFLIYD